MIQTPTICLAHAAIRRGAILILPFDALDPAQRAPVRRILDGIKRGA
jgi:hypothetical protein